MAYTLAAQVVDYQRLMIDAVAETRDEWGDGSDFCIRRMVDDSFVKDYSFIDWDDSIRAPRTFHEYVLSNRSEWDALDYDYDDYDDYEPEYTDLDMTDDEDSDQTEVIEWNEYRRVELFPEYPHYC